MRATTVKSFLIAGFACVAAALAAVGWWQHRAGCELRDKRDHLLKVTRERTRLLADQRRLAASQVSAEELARLRARQEELAKARESVLALRRALTGAKGQPLRQTAKASPPARGAEPPPLSGPRLPADEWKFAGAASPRQTFESVVWSALHGEAEQLASLLAFEKADQASLARGFAGLSAEEQAAYGSAEQLAATLLAVQVPADLSAIGTVGELTTTSGDQAVVIRLERSGGDTDKDATFVFRRDAAGQWRLVVPTSVVAELASALSRTTGGTTSR